MTNNIFIEFEYNGREIDGIEDFKNELCKYYLVQGKSRYLPACSEGGETWITIFINSSFFQFAKDVIIYGLAWDLLKKGSINYFFKPLFSALNNLEIANQKSYKLRIQSLKFQFDDIDIIFGGIEPHRIEVVSKIFNEISKRKERIEQKIKLPISKIETPIFHNPKFDKKGYSPYILNTSKGLSLESYLDLWKIWFMQNRECQIYKLNDETFINAYPN
jgi:hypothetical protein